MNDGGTTFVGFVFLGLDLGAIFQGLLGTRFFLHNDMRIDGRTLRTRRGHN
jgi:hypothetical protein